MGAKLVPTKPVKFGLLFPATDDAAKRKRKPAAKRAAAPRKSK